MKQIQNDFYIFYNLTLNIKLTLFTFKKEIIVFDRRD